MEKAPRKLWSCAACGHEWLSRLARPPICPACTERHHDCPRYLRARETLREARAREVAA